MSELNKKMLETPDLNEERLEILKNLFPDLFTMEGKLNPDELKKIIDPELVKETERFEFKWFGKNDAKRTAFTPSKATLVYDEERSVNPEFADGNMIIEGENLETLKCLLSAYRERVKCIYIDPPYNTGKDFVYSDRWDESKEDYYEHIGISKNGVKLDTNIESNGRYHSNWMNLLYSRLLLSRQLLRDDGVIIVSIDDNEIANLRRICDEVFGEDNFLGQFIINSSPSAIDYGHIGNTHEYAVFYAKDNLYTETYFLEEEDKIFKYTDAIGGFNIYPLYNGNVAFNPETRPNLFYPFYLSPKDTDENEFYKISLDKQDGFIEVYPVISKKDGIQRVWRWGKIKARENLNDEIVGYKTAEGDYRIVQKTRLTGKIIRSLQIDTLISSRKGTAEVQDLFERKVFSFPKPVELIKRFIAISTEQDSIVLDFFAGSGTTAHAVTEFNKKDGGNRKYILIQLPELTDEKSEAYKAGYKTISDITIERNKRVIEKIEKEEASKEAELFDADKEPFKTGFKVYKLAKSNFPRVDFTPDPDKSEEENIKALNKYIDEKEAMFLSMIDENNVFDEVLLKNGFMLNYSKFQEDSFSKNSVYRIKDDFKECFICMDMSIAKETLKELEGFKDTLFICLERSLDTTMKWNLKHLLGDKLVAF